MISTGLFANNSFTNNNTSTKNERLCKIFQDKALSYEKTMRNDVYATATLESYNKKINLYCTK
jgi:hypothetical protein